MTLSISTQFDSGSIEVLAATDPAAIDVAFRADSHAEFRQWFHFRLQGARGRPCRIRFVNADRCTYVEGWRDYRAVASYDRASWFRVPTTFDGKVMEVTCTPERDAIWFAYFEPYSWERHLDRLGIVARSPHVRVSSLGRTVEGRDLDLVTVGTPGPGRSPIWILARQHPGETMAEWFVEGLLDRLVDPADATARALLERAVFYIVPNMNPDGSIRGNLRTNAAGANLNREWFAPTEKRSPEVFHARAAMEATGVAAFLDVHGDEGLPYVFVDDCSRVPDYTEKQAVRDRTFTEALLAVNPDFQTVQGYAADKSTKANLALASKWAGHRFGCLSFTLEMPFKDNANAPDPVAGWSAARSRRLGADSLTALWMARRAGAIVDDK